MPDFNAIQLLFRKYDIAAWKGHNKMKIKDNHTKNWISGRQNWRAFFEIWEDENGTEYVL